MIATAFPSNKHLQYSLLLTSSLFVDQFFKYMARVQGLVTLNKGFSFSLFSLSGQWLLIVGTMAGLLLLSYLFREYWLRQWWWHGILTGAVLSNMLDRVIWGGVQDFLPIPFTGIHNNIADWVIAGVLVMLGISMFQFYPKNVK